MTNNHVDKEFHKLKLGRKPYVEDSRDLKLSKYLDVERVLAEAQLPIIPNSFGFDGRYPRNGYGMLGNDDYGNCAWAGAAHEHMVITSVAGAPAKFTAQGVLSDYAACTGFNPNDPNSDQGTNVRDAMGYRRTKGIVDANGKRHTIYAYLSVDVKNWNEIYAGLYVFETMGSGFSFPQSAMDQFNAGRPWSVVSGSPIEGGHYVPWFSRQGNRSIKLVTWARMMAATKGFMQAYMDEAYVFITTDAFNSGKTIRGFDMHTMQADLQAVVTA